MVDVTGIEPVTPCLQNSQTDSRKSLLFMQSIRASRLKHSRHMCVVVATCGHLHVGSLQKSLQFCGQGNGASL
jgi:hypothetical protein